MTSVLYYSTVGSLVYAIIGTQVDIAYAMGLVKYYITNSEPLHWTTIKQVFHYLKGTMDHRPSYTGSPNLSIIGYFDGDYAEDIDI